MEQPKLHCITYCFHMKGMKEREMGKEYYKEVPVRRERKNCQLPRVRCAVVLAVVCQNYRGSDQWTGLDGSCRNT